MIVRKWIGLFVRGVETRTLTVEAPLDRLEDLHRSICNHVRELIVDGWVLASETYITLWEDTDESERGGSGKRRA